MKNPFAYPPGFEWLVVLASSPPGAMIWLPMYDAETGERHLAFALREESHVIERLPSAKPGTAIIEWRMGVLGLDAPSGKTVAFLDVSDKDPWWNL